jgi:hypothetical protein
MLALVPPCPLIYRWRQAEWATVCPQPQVASLERRPLSAGGEDPTPHLSVLDSGPDLTIPHLTDDAATPDRRVSPSPDPDSPTDYE